MERLTFTLLMVVGFVLGCGRDVTEPVRERPAFVLLEAGTVSQVSVGGGHSCALRSNGTVACWGLDGSGQATPPAGMFTQLSAGDAHTCGVKSDGTIICWGANASAQATPPAGTFARVSAGGTHTCALKTDGTVACWGDDTYGQTTPPAGTFTDVSAGGLHTCGLKDDGMVLCWGSNFYGETQPPAATSFIQVSAGQTHTCGVKTDDTLACWGSHIYGPTEPPQGPFRQVGAGNSHSCAVRTDGTLACWGRNGGGGSPYRDGSSPPPGTFTHVSAGGENFHSQYGERGHACGVTTDGTVVCWGYNRYEPPPTATFTALSAGASHTCALNPDDTVTCWGASSLWGMAGAPPGTFRQVSAGNDHNCGVKTDGTLACWGINLPSPPAGTFTHVSVGGKTRIPENGGETGHACAVRTDDGTVVCWGYNVDGQATPPAGMFTEVSAGRNHSCGLQTDGTIACWGSNSAGQATPPAGTFTHVDAGRLHTCALKADHTVVCWGDNGQGQAAPPGDAFSQVSAGGLHSCGLKTDGTIACWGDNGYGQTTAPAGVFTQVSAGDNYTCALESDASVACWGEKSIAETSPSSSVAASEYQPPNVPENTQDNNLDTRWSAEGDGQWIQYDLGTPTAIGRVDIAWYNGNQWESAFEITVSQDAVNWTPVFAGRSSGKTVEAEGYGFSTITARYVRITGHGQWNGSTLSSWWNSITEVDIHNVLPVTGVVASGHQSPNVPENTLDNNLGTRWSAEGDGQWIQYDLGAPTAIGAVDVAWYNGNLWQSEFAIEVSPDGRRWTPVFAGRSSGQTVQYEHYAFQAFTCRYVRILGHGQWNGTALSSWWNSLVDVDIRRGSGGTFPCPVPQSHESITVASVTASAYQTPNVPENTLDHSLGTRWSAEGDGQWIQYDLGVPKAVGSVDIAWYQQSPNTWESWFDIDVSSDGVTWKRVVAGRSTAGTLTLQRYGFSTVTCRYVRIIGRGQFNGTTLSSLWNSITEVEIRPASDVGYTCPQPAPPAVSGLGTLGPGSATVGSDLKEFDFEVTADLTGTLFYRDWGYVRPDGTVGTLTVHPNVPRTGITAYQHEASICPDPTRGVTFQGVGLTDLSALVDFTIQVCDTGTPGSGLDVFQIDVEPPHEYRRNGVLSSGDIGKSGGDAPVASRN